MIGQAAPRLHHAHSLRVTRSQLEPSIRGGNKTWDGTEPVDKAEQGWDGRIERRIATLTERLSGGVWTWHGDRLMRAQVREQEFVPC